MDDDILRMKSSNKIYFHLGPLIYKYPLLPPQQLIDHLCKVYIYMHTAHFRIMVTNNNSETLNYGTSQ